MLLANGATVDQTDEHGRCRSRSLPTLPVCLRLLLARGCCGLCSRVSVSLAGRRCTKRRRLDIPT